MQFRINVALIMIASLCDANLWSSPESVKGKKLYAQYCAECHGQGGEGVENEFSKPLIGDWPIEKLETLVTRNSMIGVELAQDPA